RDALAVTLSLLLLWVLSAADDASPRRWCAAGMLFAVAVLARETTLVFAPLVALWACQQFWRRPASCAAAVGAFVAGAGLGVLPLVARTMRVGGPPWRRSTRGVDAFGLGPAAGDPPVGLPPPPATRSILMAADGRLGRAIRLTVASYEGDWRRLVEYEITKLGAVVSRYEGTYKPNWDYFADRCPFLRRSLPFGGRRAS